MKNVKKNNKGFSLVELIVVVMIMAIIAVALAPQVMKWVNNSRQATDVQTIDALVSACQLACTNKDYATTDKNFTFNSSTRKITLGTSGYEKVVADYLGQSTVELLSDINATVTVTKGVVTKTITGMSSDIE